MKNIHREQLKGSWCTYWRWRIAKGPRDRWERNRTFRRNGKHESEVREQQRDQEAVVKAVEVMIVGSKEEPEGLRRIRDLKIRRGMKRWRNQITTRGTEDSANMAKTKKFTVLSKSKEDKQLDKAP